MGILVVEFVLDGCPAGGGDEIFLALPVACGHGGACEAAHEGNVRPLLEALHWILL